MDSREYKEKIKKIIKRGYNLKLISAELKIPMEELEMYKNEIEKENQKKTTTEIITRRNTRTVHDSMQYSRHSRMSMLKDKYYKLYNKGSKNNFITEKRTLTEQENDKLEKLFEEVKEKLPEVAKQSTLATSKRKYANKFLTEIVKSEDILPYFDKIEQIYMLFAQDNLDNLASNYKDSIDKIITKIRNILSRVFAKAVYEEAQSTDDIEMLKQFLNRIKNIKSKGIAIESYEREIKTKLNKLIVEQNQRDRRNNETDEIKMIAQQLADGKVNMEETNRIIDAEAKRRYENSPKNKFSLTEERQRKQVLMQLGQMLSKQGKKYKIVNPEATLKLMQTLCETKLEPALAAVNDNLLSCYRFEEAEQLCKKYYSQDPLNLGIKLQKNKVKNAELSYLILRGIRETNSPAEENKLYELLKDGLEMGNLKPESIDLGTNRDGTQKITLADILDEDKFLREGI